MSCYEVYHEYKKTGGQNVDEVKPDEIKTHCCWENKDVPVPVWWKRERGASKTD